MTDQTPSGDLPYVRVDSRRRVTLPKEAAKTGQMFLVDVRDDGNIMLMPAVAVPLGTLGLSDPTTD